jgi:quercetin dioxygenase-like cupin family protein/DNA-binding XRE family transcriptional regulator
LKEVADGIDMTPSFISHIERGKANPSISTLKDIADLFGKTIGALLDSSADNADHNPVLRKGERKTLTTARNAKYQLLSHGYDMNCELSLVEFAPGATTGGHRLTHEGVECAYVFSGQLRVELGDEVYVMKPGDSMTFLSTVPHVVMNTTRRKAIAIWANSIPWIFRNR